MNCPVSHLEWGRGSKEYSSAPQSLRAQTLSPLKSRSYNAPSPSPFENGTANTRPFNNYDLEHLSPKLPKFVAHSYENGARILFQIDGLRVHVQSYEREYSSAMQCVLQGTRGTFTIF